MRKQEWLDELIKDEYKAATQQFSCSETSIKQEKKNILDTCTIYNREIALDLPLQIKILPYREQWYKGAVRGWRIQ